MNLFEFKNVLIDMHDQAIYFCCHWKLWEPQLKWIVIMFTFPLYPQRLYLSAMHYNKNSERPQKQQMLNQFSNFTSQKLKSQFALLSPWKIPQTSVSLLKKFITNQNLNSK